MQSYEVIKYSPQFYDEWNEFVMTSKNATFLFHRDFMEYHKDRFEDYSLIVYKDKKVMALFPANKSSNDIISHQGLTYGGLLIQSDIKFESVLKCFYTLLKFLHTNAFKVMSIKLLPSIYNQLPSDEMLYCMFLLNAKLIKRDTLSVVNQKTSLKFSKDRIKGYKRALKHRLSIKEEDNFDSFWNEILIPNLKEKYNVSPVHSIEEIKLLKQKFPDYIKQYNIYHENKIVAGTTIFITKSVAHAQYISGDLNTNKLGSLDMLFHHLIKNVFIDKEYFDFGASNENEGKQINKGLQFWKEGFGARTITQNFYNVEIKNYNLLENVLI
ncbi:GNAT family N-acetyltransferase [Yeosuana marina]|uniref:GNAT family N-acetyltransferase n=1 Tax=Yeosuana marina TaxID=1565536 RepID=UPI00141DF010|nr:GNAT family N-acetyltransferase [Yeosuana marina]